MTATVDEFQRMTAAIDARQQGVREEDVARIYNGQPLQAEELLEQRLAFHRADAKARQILADETAAQDATGEVEGEEPEHRRAAIDAMRSKVLDREGLRGMTGNRYLIKGVLDFDSESWLIGASGGFKSFVAVDWACHVATGRQWWGRRIRKGRVLYVVAEGAKAFGKRIDAWEVANGVDVTDMLVMPAPVQARASGVRDTVSYDWITLCRMAAEDGFDLVILDTQARMTVGLEENSNTAMGVWIEAVRMLREATKACILVVHHTGRNGMDARGASALDGAQDAEWKVARNGPKAKRLAKLSCEKSKDGNDDQTFDFQAHIVELGEDEDGDPITSLVLRQTTAENAEHLSEEGKEQEFAGYDHELNLTSNQVEVMDVLREVIDHRGTTKSAILRIVNERRKEKAQKTDGKYKPMPRASLDSALTALDRKGAAVPLNATGERWVDGDKYEPDLDEAA